MHKYMFICVVLISALSYFAQDFAGQSPAVQPATADESVFSAERTLAVLAEILPDNQPHPTGSEANRLVKERILEWLNNHDIDYEVQNAWGCSNAKGRCAPVQNIIATLEGEEGKPFVTLMSHYDSTPASMGAGDNGSGVATILEIGRLLREQKLVNPLMLLITDAEENGLLGAEAFFTQHRLRDEVGVVINLEASTTTGRSFLFRTSTANLELVRSYGQVAKVPGGTSLYNEVFKQMASDTDFSVPKRLGYPGMDFVFVGEPSHHHTTNDKIENLSPVSVQHHGENVYPLVQALTSRPLQVASDTEAVFLNLFGFWLSWSVAANVGLLLFGMALLAFAAQRTVTDWRQMLAAVALPLTLFFSITFVGGSVFLITHFVNGTTPFWPAHLGPYRLMLFGVPFAIALYFAQRFNSDFEISEGLVGVWLSWALLAVGFTIWLPSAAFLFLLPLAVASTCLMLASFLPRWSLVFYFATIPTVAAIHLPIIMLLEKSQGYWFIAATFIFFSLYTSAILPLIRGQFVLLGQRLFIGMTVVGFLLAVSLPGFSEWRPQTAIFQVVENVDDRRAWLQFLSLNRVPESVLKVQAFDSEAAIFPWTDDEEASLMSIEIANLPAPTLTVIADEQDDFERRVTIELHSNREARDLGLVIPSEARATSFAIGGHEYAFEPIEWGSWKDQHALEFRGISDRKIRLAIAFERSGPVTAHLYDFTTGISPDFDHLIRAREPLVVQVHQGDRTQAITTVTF